MRRRLGVQRRLSGWRQRLVPQREPGERVVVRACAGVRWELAQGLAEGVGREWTSEGSGRRRTGRACPRRRGRAPQLRLPQNVARHLVRSRLRSLCRTSQRRRASFRRRVPTRRSWLQGLGRELLTREDRQVGFPAEGAGEVDAGLTDGGVQLVFLSGWGCTGSAGAASGGCSRWVRGGGAGCIGGWCTWRRLLRLEDRTAAEDKKKTAESAMAKSHQASEAQH